MIICHIYYSYWLSVGIILTGANAKGQICMRMTHSVFFSIWTYYPYIGTLYGPNHTWKVHNIIYHLFESAKFWRNDRKYPFLFTIAIETLWMTVRAANTETPNKSPIILNLLKGSSCINLKALRTCYLGESGQSALVNGQVLSKVKTQSKIFFYIVFLQIVTSVHKMPNSPNMYIT